MADFEGQWPIPKFHFRVSVGDETMSFQEVSGLETTTEVIEYRHGDSEVFSTIKMAGLVKTGTLTLKKGVFTDDDRLLEIFNQIYEKDYYGEEDSRIDILVELLDETGETVMGWNIERAFPIKFSGTDLKSDANEVAIESIEFAYESIRTSLDGSLTAE
ncbi:MAG: phage tail protein [Phaeodactylibacter sp.]|nr:phage tail protein [Phaeodactylibacter sp.]